MMVSPDEASEMACPIVLQAVVGERQLWLSLPVPPFAYHVVLANTAGANNISAAKNNNAFNFIVPLLPVEEFQDPWLKAG